MKSHTVYFLLMAVMSAHSQHLYRRNSRLSIIQVFRQDLIQLQEEFRKPQLPLSPLKVRDEGRIEVNISISWKALSSSPDDLGKKICPDKAISCGDNQTCCPTPTSYKCCPYKEGQCCKDKDHCCPVYSQCDVEHSRCLIPNLGFLDGRTLDKVVQLLNLTVNDGSLCPNKIDRCNQGETCCPMANGSFGCCQLEDGICCADMKHCCPKGASCDLRHGRCVKNDEISVQKKEPSLKWQSVCPDIDTVCNNGQTCCLTDFGDYRCCPYDRAACCPDGKHCCPHGTVCNMTTLTCDSKHLETSLVSPLMLKDSRSPHVIINCPNKDYQCYEGETCCKLPDGGYGCCRFPDATCCADQLHCCPKNTECDLGMGICKSKQVRLENARLYPTIDTLTKSSNETVGDDCHGDTHIQCSDGNTCCERGDTCCSQTAHPWMMCCPVENATCCPGGTKCCPWGYICKEVAGGDYGCQIAPVIDD